MKLQRLLLVGCVFLLGSATVWALTNDSDCGFYSQTASQLHCSSNNYLVRFGDHYCREFAKVEPLFSPEGQQVLNCIRPCLIDALERPDLTCANVQQLAFASHVKCYSQCGFCEMSPIDQLAIGAVVWREFFDPDFRAIMDEVSRECVVNVQAVGRKL